MLNLNFDGSSSAINDFPDFPDCPHRSQYNLPAPSQSAQRRASFALYPGVIGHE